MAFVEKYTTVLGAGLHDGSSEANSWNLEESTTAALAAAYAAAAGSLRWNIKGGTYPTLGTALTTPTAANAKLFVCQGYNSTPGDLDLTPANARANSGTGALVKTNWPIITLNGVAITTGTYNILANHSIASNINASTVITGVSCIVRCCSLSNTNTTGGTVVAMTTGNYGSVHNCDLYIASNNAVSTGITLARSLASNLRIIGGGYGRGLVSSLETSIGDSVIAGFGTGMAPTMFGFLAKNISFYDVTGGCLQITDGVYSLLNSVAWNVKHLVDNASDQNVILQACAAGTVANGGLKSGGSRVKTASNILDLDPISLTASPYVDAANGDFRLNVAACKAAGLWPSIDLGAIQATGGVDLPDLMRFGV